MDRTAATTHSEHDELLIARLFGGDVTEPERDRALDAMSECGECAAIFADLGAIESAVVEMAIPARPRDFAITPQDAARLRRKPWLAGLAGWAGLRRALGGSIAALGLVGLVATNLMSGTGPGSGFGLTSNSQRDAAQPVMAAATAAPAGMPTSASTVNPAALGPVPVSSGDHLTTDTSSPPERPAATPPATSPTQELAAASPGDKTAASTPPNPAATRYVICCGPSSDGTNSTGSVSVTPEPASSSHGPDATMIWLAGFGGLFLVGLIVLLAPLLKRIRRSRGTPRG